jgi:hypothetical protein
VCSDEETGHGKKCRIIDAKAEPGKPAPGWVAVRRPRLLLKGRGELDAAALMLERARSTSNQTRVQYLNLIEVLLEQDLADSALIVQQTVAEQC